MNDTKSILRNIYGQYSIIKKEWNWWNDVAEWVGYAGVNGVMGFDFFDPWMFDQVMEIKFKDTKDEGLLLKFYNRKIEQKPQRQIIIAIAESILKNFFNAEVVFESYYGYQYFLSGYDVKKFFNEWADRIKGEFIYSEKSVHGCDITVPGKKYSIFVDNKIEYVWLDTKYFTKNGFDSKIGANGVFDVSENKIKFSIWSLEDVYGIFRPAKYIDFFDGKNIYSENVYFCVFDGNMQNFENVCNFL